MAAMGAPAVPRLIELLSLPVRIVPDAGPLRIGELAGQRIPTLDLRILCQRGLESIDRAAVPGLLAALEHSDPQVRATLYQILKELRLPETTGAFLRTLNTLDASMLYDATFALWFIVLDFPHVAEFVVERLPTVLDVYSRILPDDTALPDNNKHHIISLLANLPDDAAVTALLEILDQEEIESRVDVLWNLKQAASPLAIPRMMALLEDETRYHWGFEKPIFVCDLAANVLQNTPGSPPLSEWKAQRIARVAALLESDDLDRHEEAGNLFDSMGETWLRADDWAHLLPLVMRSLTLMLATGTTNRGLFSVLAMIGGPEAIPMVDPLMDGPGNGLAWNVMLGVAARYPDSPEVAIARARAIMYHQYPLRGAGRFARNLGRIGDEQSAAYLFEVLADRRRDYHGDIHVALAQISRRHPTLVQQVIALVQERWHVPEAREDALHGMAELGDPSLLPLMLDSLSDGEVSHRTNAIKGLARLGQIHPSLQEQIVEALIPSLEDWEKDYSDHGKRICLTTRIALEQIGTLEALDAVRAWAERHPAR